MLYKKCKHGEFGTLMCYCTKPALYEIATPSGCCCTDSCQSKIEAAAKWNIITSEEQSEETLNID